jgi:hypothetical protein
MKRVGCFFIVFCGALVTGAILFLSSLSVWIGISHQEKDGCWVPVLAGSLTGILFLYSFFRLSRNLLGQTRHTDSIDV